MARIKNVPRRDARGKFMARSKKAAMRRERVVPLKSGNMAPMRAPSMRQSNAIVNIAKAIAKEGSLQSGLANAKQARLPSYVADKAGGQISEIATAGFFAVPPEANTV
jgi:hypothetical protein